MKTIDAKKIYVCVTKVHESGRQIELVDDKVTAKQLDPNFVQASMFNLNQWARVAEPFEGLIHTTDGIVQWHEELDEEGDIVDCGYRIVA